jgi:hypothetical protein
MKFSKRIRFFKFCLFIGIPALLFVNACSKSSSGTTTPPVDKTGLQHVIDSANWYLANTVEGTKPGEYTVGSKANLKTATDAANSVLNAAGSTQSE